MAAEYIHHQNTILLLSGRAGCGKNTISGLIESELQDTHITKEFAFADKLKVIVSDLLKVFCNYEVDPISMNSLEVKQNLHPYLKMYKNGFEAPLQIRHLLQTVGTEIIRTQLGHDIFSSTVAKDVYEFFIECNMSGYPGFAIITDLRFPNELDVIEKFFPNSTFNIIVAKIHRPNRETDDMNAHISEMLFNDIPHDILIDNDGDVEDLRRTITEILPELLHRDTK